MPYKTVKIGVTLEEIIDDANIGDAIYFDDGTIGIALDETTALADVMDMYTAFGGERPSYEVEDLLVDQLCLTSRLSTSRPRYR